MIAIVDYGVGNIKAFANIYRNLNIPFKFASQEDDFNNVTKIILPGVGAFDHAMDCLMKSGLKNILDHLVIEKKTPVLGVCVGLQMMADSSAEGDKPGLGWIKGTVKKFNNDDLIKHPLPHMGWNTWTFNKSNPLFIGLPDEAKFYFLHSFYIDCNAMNNVIATSEYGHQFTSAINQHNIFGIQPHPEKSHDNGIKILENFGDL